MAHQAGRLGREKDPRTPEDVGVGVMAMRKSLWRCLEAMGTRRLPALLFPKDTVHSFDVRDYPGVRGRVAFTVDDAFCGLDNPGGEMTREVCALFRKYGARATFFVTATHAHHAERKAVLELLGEGHELANHSTEDRPYHRETGAAFEADLEETQRVIAGFQDHRVPWYRSPHARYSPAMASVLQDKGMTHVMVDAFANDTAIPDPAWIAETVLRCVQEGSILLVHMPERGVREWNLEAMEKVLAGLQERSLQAVTVTELVAAAGWRPPSSTHQPPTQAESSQVKPVP